MVPSERAHLRAARKLLGRQPIEDAAAAEVVSSWTKRRSSAITVPMMAASLPSGCARIAASSVSASAGAQIARSGSMPSSSDRGDGISRLLREDAAVHEHGGTVIPSTSTA
jgi:hypothetical protein